MADSDDGCRGTEGRGQARRGDTIEYQNCSSMDSIIANIYNPCYLILPFELEALVRRISPPSPPPFLCESFHVISDLPASIGVQNPTANVVMEKRAVAKREY